MSTLNIGSNVQISGTTQAVTGLLYAEGIVPAGSVIFVARSTVPTGYLACNGASLSTTTYAALFAAISYTFGGSGASFTVPDLRGEFLRGWDNGRGVDSGRGFGTFQSQAIQSHNHGIRVSGADDNNHTGNGTAAANSDAGENATNGVEYAGGPETRPRNIALLACIKY